MEYESVRVEQEGPIAILFLNRPEKRNALNAAMRREIIHALDRLETDESVRAIILTGSGDSAFVAGADVAEFAHRSVSEQREHTFGRRVYDAVASHPKPTIAAIHGFCVGGGSELALACDLRVATRSARIGQAEIRIGLIPGAGGTQRMTRLVGYGQTLRLALTGDLIDGAEAYRIGLVEYLAEDGDHLDTARKVAAKIAAWSPLSLSLVKRAVAASMEMPLSAGLEFERELFLTAFSSQGGREGVRAFVEGRKPKFHEA